MQTFKLELGVSLKAVITQQFLDESRKEAQAPEATAFLKAVQERFPEDDDQFMLAIVTNAFRTATRYGALNFMSVSGVGGTVAPVEIVSKEVHVPKVFSETAPGGTTERQSKKDTLVLGFDPGVPPVLADDALSSDA